MDLKNPVNAILLLLLLFYATVLATANIGFDLRDEGYYFLGYERNQDLFFLFSGSHKLIRLLPFSDHIVINRIYRVVLILTASLIFARSLNRACFTKDKFWIVFSWVLLANTVSYLFGPISLSYNTLNLLMLQVTFAVLIDIYLSSHGLNKYKRFLRLLLFSFLLSLLIVNKPSTGALVTILFAVSLFYLYRKIPGKAVKDLLFVGISSIVFTCTVYFLMYQDQLKLILSLLLQKQFYPGDQHLNFAFLFKQTLVKPFHDAKGVILFALAYLVIYFIWKKNIIRYKVFLSLFFLLLFLSIVSYHKFYYNGYAGAQFIYSYLLFIVIANYQLIKGKLKELDHSKKYIIVWLALLPIIGFWGSDVPFFLGVLNLIGFHVLLFLFFQESRLYGFRIFSILIVGFAFYVNLFNPYSNPTVFQQKNKINSSKANLFVSDYVYDEYLALLKVKPFILESDALINIGTPVGSLYLCELKSFHTIYFNSVFFNNGYLQLIKNTTFNKRVQILYNKKSNHSDSYKKMKDGFYMFLLDKGYTLSKNIETEKYELVTLSPKSFVNGFGSEKLADFN
ncbi:hypothetical protein HRG84_23050 [Flavisolibacter sp. BT320]|nr:hypothetical protein [Flavisolibacter longurius]